MRKEKWIKTVTLSAAMLGVFAFSLSTAACIGGDDSGSGSICEDPVTYSVLFYDYDGRVLDEQTVEEGEVPVYGGETPVRATAEGIEYSFEGWKQDGVLLLSLPAITANTEFTASYTADPIEYKVTFVVGGDSTTEDYHWGETPSYKGEEKFVKNGVLYTIVGWDKTFESVYGEQTYTAVLESADAFKATFVVGTESYEQYVKIGSAPVFYGTPYLDKEDKCSYEFSHWTANGQEYTSLPVLNADTVFTAVFDEIKNTFTVEFLSETGESLHSEQVIYGETPTYTQIPQKAESAGYRYEFNGWKSKHVLYEELPAIKSDTHFVAVFEGKAKTYTLSITYKNGTSTQTIDYSYAYGENYVIKTPEIAGKTADFTVVKGVVTGDVQEIVTYTDQAAWDGTVATAFAGGDGTQANPYKIATASQLAYLSKISKGTASSVFTYYGEGVYYELTANINLNNQPWTPIAHRGSTTNYNWRYFAGNFNGNGYTISGLSIKKSTFGVGLFESVSGTIENLNLVGEISVNHRAGALAYYLKSGTVRNIVSKVDITLTNTSTVYTGGIIGTASDSTLENCVNYGIVKSTGSRTGGVIGSLSFSYEDETVTGNSYLTNCKNYAPVYGKGIVGGIVGYGQATISECENYGGIYGDGNGSGNTAAGGIAGYNKGSIVNCVNYGAVNSTSYLVGGICGDFIQSSLVAAYEVKNCDNYGVVVSAVKSGNAVTGGILGRADCATNSAGKLVHNKIVDCNNYGTVIAERHYVGGIVGANNGGYVITCVNYGDVQASTGTYVGGIVGANYNYGDVATCTNRGCIAGGETYGQIHGQLTSTSTVSGNSELGELII